jgi:hypothetical protein
MEIKGIYQKIHSPIAPLNTSQFLCSPKSTSILAKKRGENT